MFIKKKKRKGKEETKKIPFSRRELHFVKFFVDAAALHEFVVRSRFGNFALFQNDDQIGVQNGREPVRDAKSRAAFHEFVEFRLHLAFDSVSSALVASSKIKIGALRKTARAMARR